VLTKPFTADELLASIVQVVGEEPGRVEGGQRDLA
jgi:hypothetical protein